MTIRVSRFGIGVKLQLIRGLRRGGFLGKQWESVEGLWLRRLPFVEIL